MIDLMKQRRRWMNGAIFGTSKVLSNFLEMISCRRTKHGFIHKTGILIFLIYLASFFILQFFVVGAMFAAIYAFINQVFASNLPNNTTL